MTTAIKFITSFNKANRSRNRKQLKIIFCQIQEKICTIIKTQMVSKISGLKKIKNQICISVQVDYVYNVSFVQKGKNSTSDNVFYACNENFTFRLISSLLLLLSQPGRDSSGCDIRNRIHKEQYQIKTRRNIPKHRKRS